jgi:predicted nucleotidyltransferase component of viral defense system
MDNVDYKELYELQDKVLEIVFAAEREFYLTGGTCISRFYLEKRYSDDLDFFTNQSRRYSFAVKNIKIALQKIFNVSIEVESKDFTRFKIDGILQVDFVNDMACRYKEPLLNEKKFLYDNIENILSNKITAVMGRDNPKDIFDIFLIWKNYDFAWKEILDAAHEKAGFTNDELIIRLKSFPKELLEKIKITDKTFLDDFETGFDKMIKEILNLI